MENISHRSYIGAAAYSSEFIEISSGCCLGEDEITRFDERYGRC